MRIIKHSSNSTGDRGPCEPLAFAALTGRSFEDINAYFIAKGYRKPNRGTTWTRIPMLAFGLEPLTLQEHSYVRDLTVNRFWQRPLKGGSFLIHVAGHALAYKAGICYDTIDSSKRRIKRMWRLVRPGELPIDFEQVVAWYKKQQEKKRNEKVKKIHAQLFHNSIYAGEQKPKLSPKGEEKAAVLHHIALFKEKGIKFTIKDLAIASGASYIYARWILQHNN